MIREVARATLSAACVFATLLAAVSPAVLRAAEPSPLAAKVAGSLDFVPSDVSFYSVMLRNQEQLDILLASNAWQKLKALPSVKAAWEQLESQWTDGPLAQAAQLLSMPENEELLSLLGDMGSREVFMYGDGQISALLDLFNEMNNATHLSTISYILQAMQGRFDEDPSVAQKRAMLDTLADNLKILDAPTLVLGFKVDDVAAAERQLKRLEVLTKFALNQSPELRGRFERKKIGAGDFLTLALDGSLFPWDKVGLDRDSMAQYAAEPGQYDALHDKLKALTLSIDIGLYRNYLLLTVSKSTEHLASLGSGETLVRDGRLDAVGKFTDQRLTSVGYLSQDLMARIKGTPENADYLKEMAEDLLDEAGVDGDLRKSMLKDIESFATDLKTLIPRPGELVTFSFLTPRGVESYSLDHSENLSWDGSRPLDLLDHVGGAPLIASVARAKSSLDQYKTIAKWTRIGWDYVEKYAIPRFFAVAHVDDEKKAEFKQFLNAFKPLVERTNTTTIDKLFPALADGQVGLVVDGRWTSKQWVRQTPETADSMALPEFALVLGVTDAKLLKSAVSDYQAIADDAVAAIRKLQPSWLPPRFKLPRPVKKTAGPGEAYVYSLPAEAGLDPQIAPNAALAEHTAVLSLSLPHSARLLAPTPFRGSGVLPDAKQSLANAVVWDWSGSVELAAPWVLFGVKNYGAIAAQAAATGFSESGDPDDKGAVKPEVEFDLDVILPQVRDGLGLLKTLRTITSAQRIEEKTGTMIRHTEFFFEDHP